MKCYLLDSFNTRIDPTDIFIFVTVSQNKIIEIISLSNQLVTEYHNMWLECERAKRKS